MRAKNINPLTHTRLPRYVRGHVGVIERVIGCHVFPDSNATRRRRKSAMALHRALRRPRIVGRRCRPEREGLGRRLGAVSGAGMIDRRRRPPRHARSAEHPARRRRAGVPRAVGGAGLRHDAGAARARPVHLERMGGGARRRDQARARRPAIPTPARPIIRTGSRRWKSWSRKKASRRRTLCIAIAMPGTTPATAPRTAGLIKDGFAPIEFQQPGFADDFPKTGSPPISYAPQPLAHHVAGEQQRAEHDDHGGRRGFQAAQQAACRRPAWPWPAARPARARRPRAWRCRRP